MDKANTKIIEVGRNKLTTDQFNVIRNIKLTQESGQLVIIYDI